MLLALGALLMIWAAKFLPGDFAATLNPTPLQFLTSGITSATYPGLVLSSIALLLLIPPAVKKLGTVKTLVAAVIFQLVAALGGLGLAWLLAASGDYWGVQLRSEIYLTPVPWIFGLAGFASATYTTLWARRVRISIIGLALTALLFAGTLTTFPLLVASVAGVLAGQLLIRRSMTIGRVSRREARILVSVFLFAATCGPFVTSLIPGAAGPFHSASMLAWTDPTSLQDAASHCATIHAAHCIDSMDTVTTMGIVGLIVNQMPLLVVAVIAVGLARGRRLAWWLMLLAQLATFAVLFRALDIVIDTDHVFALLDAIGVLLPTTVCIILLLVTRHLFRTTGSRIPAGIFSLIGLTALTLGLWAGGSATQRTHFQPDWTPADWVAVFAPPVLGITRTHIPTTQLAWLVTLAPTVVFWVGLAIITYITLVHVPHHTGDARTAEKILARGSGDHLAAMTLWRGNRYYIDPQGEGYVAYQVHSATAITLGAPIITGKNDPARRQALASRFESYCADQGWRIAWYSVDDTFTRPGYKSLKVAEESIIDVADGVEFKGKKFQDIRTARNRAGKENIHTLFTTWDDASTSVREKIIALSEDWVSDKALPEMGFTLGGIEELPGAYLMLALDDDDNLHGVTSWLPVVDDGKEIGLMLDFMRRNTQGFRPVVEYLIAETALLAHERGLQWISLSGAPLASTQPTNTDNEEEKVLTDFLDWVGHTMEPLYGFRSLAAFKSKFHPRHVDWMLLYRDELALPAIGMAIIKCYLPTMTPRQALAAIRALRQAN